MKSAYEQWMNQSVVLEVATADIRVPLRGTLIGESDETVRFRVGDNWDIDIYKSMILAVEEDEWVAISRTLDASLGAAA
jgi:hypothetical protein